MAQTDRCPECGAERSDGICPRCLIRLGIDGAGPGRSRPSSPGETTAPGVLDSIAASIGPVPRVLLRDTAPGEEPGPIVRPRAGDDDDRSIRYRIDGEIARGGMGAILKGRDPDLGRDVALKVLRDDLRDDDGMVRRFVEEAQIGGQLQHPGIVPIYELGTFADRRPFFAMKLVKGHTLAQLLEARDGPDDDRPRFLSIFEAIAQTVAYAHARGVIHRDLKPSNVMVGSFGEVQVMDWGLAKVLPRGGVVDDEKAGKDDRQETVIATASSGSDAPGLSRARLGDGDAGVHGAGAGPRRGRPGRRACRRRSRWARSSARSSPASRPSWAGPRARSSARRRWATWPTPMARLDACGADAELIAIAEGLPGARGRGPPAARRRRGRAGHGLSRRRAGPPPRRRDRPRGRGRPRRGGHPHRRRGQRARPGRAPRAAVPGRAGGLAAGADHRGRARPSPTCSSSTSSGARGWPRCSPRPRRCATGPAARPAIPARGATPWRRWSAAEGQGPEVEALRDEIQAGLEEAERGVRLRQELVEVRANQYDVGVEGTDAAYANAFRDAGLDLDALAPAEFARRLRRQPEAVVIEVSAFLDDWSAVRRAASRPVAAWRKPMEAARLADPEPYRDRLRTILLAEDRKPQAEALKALAAAPEVGRAAGADGRPAGQDPGGHRPGRAGRGPAARRGRPPPRRRLGQLRPGRGPGQAAAVGPRGGGAVLHGGPRLRPETAHELAHLLERMGRGAEAEAVFRDLTDRRPENARHLGCLGSDLKERGRAAEAAPILDRAVAAAARRSGSSPTTPRPTPTSATPWVPRGSWTRPSPNTARRSGSSPTTPGPTSTSATPWEPRGRPTEAIAEYREAIRLQPDHANAHSNLGARSAIV